MNINRYKLPLFLILLVFCATGATARPIIIDEYSGEAFCTGMGKYTSTCELDTVPILSIDAADYLFHLSFDFDNSTFSGYTEITLTNPDGGAPGNIVLDASSELLTINNVERLDGGEILNYSHENDILTFEIPEDFWDTLEVMIEYSGIEGQVDGPFGGMGVWMTQDKAWSFFFPDGAHAFTPIVDNPSCKAPVTWELGVPDDLTAVANGHLFDYWTENGENWFVWIEEDPVCSSEIGFAIAAYTIIEAQTDPFPIRYYVYPQDEAEATFDFERIPEAVELFEDTFGREYPFSELKIVECGVFGGWGGQEHQTMISLGHNMITGNRTYENIVVHEIAHMWFADLVTPAHWKDFWLNEGFAVWSEAVWADHLSGWDSYLDEIESDRNDYFSWENQGHNHALVNTDYDETMASALPYERGALAVHQLRMRYGDEDFSTAVSDYLNNHEYGHVCSNDLYNQFYETTGDENLDLWFDQWIYRGEAPLIHWTVGGQDNSIIYARQVFDRYNSPEHGGLYDCLRLTYGSPEQLQVMDWPEGEESVFWQLEDWNGDPPDNPTLFPNLEAPARLVFVDDLEEPSPSFRMSITNETNNPDHVIQSGESVTIDFYFKNSGLPIGEVNWNLDTGDEYRLTWDNTEGSFMDMEFLGDEILVFSVDVTGSGDGFPDLLEYEMTLESSNEELPFEETLSFTISYGRSEILLIEDGVTGTIDSLSQILVSLDVVWGTPTEGLDELPEDMYNTNAVMIEADGRYAEYLFTGDDQVLLDYFSFNGSGSISGQYLDQAYIDAHPDWGVALPGEWSSEELTGPAFFGIEDDPVSDGRNVLATGQDGVTVCAPCCGNIPTFMSVMDQAVAARLDYGWRITTFGFSLAKLVNTAPATMRRDELVERVAEYILVRDLNSVEDEVEYSLPGVFSLNAYPNPFNSELNISVVLPQPGDLNVNIFNLLGQKVASLENNRLVSGPVTFTWNADGFSSGIYLVRAQAEDDVKVHKVMLLK